MDFKEYLALTEDQATAAFVPGVTTGSEVSDTHRMTGRPNYLSGTDLIMPQVTKSGQIKFMQEKANPIVIILSDGTKMNFTYDEFLRIKGGKPELGKTMTVIFQRRLNDNSSVHSKIDSITVH